jgi:hypothetical protein
MPAVDELAGLNSPDWEFTGAEYELAYIIMAIKGKMNLTRIRQPRSRSGTEPQRDTI